MSFPTHLSIQFLLSSIVILHFSNALTDTHYATLQELINAYKAQFCTYDFGIRITYFSVNINEKRIFLFYGRSGKAQERVNQNFYDSRRLKTKSNVRGCPFRIQAQKLQLQSICSSAGRFFHEWLNIQLLSRLPPINAIVGEL